MTARPVPRLRRPFDFTPDLPGSKSDANRALVAAALRPGTTRVLGAGNADDVRHLVAGLRTLGFSIETEDEVRGDYCVQGGLDGLAGDGATAEGRLVCGNAGTALRFLVSVAALVPGTWTIDGDEHMRRRPVAELVAAWRGLGLEVSDTEGCPPVTLRGGFRGGGRAEVDASRSGQFLSSLLLAASGLSGGLTCELPARPASEAYVAMTVATIERFGGRIEVADDGRRYEVHPPVSSGGPEVYEVEADWSAQGVWTALSAMTRSRTGTAGLRVDSGQPDRGLARAIAALDGEGVVEIDVSTMPDQLMNLAVVAARRAADTRFVGAANLRHKECDRLAVTARELGRLGGEVEVEDDGLFVRGGRSIRGGRVNPEDDHRMAMAFAALGTLVDGVEIESPDCVAKSYPGFWRDLVRAGESPRAIALVGMRAAGKSALGAALAPALGLAFFDVDRVFESETGPIADFVAAQGWPAFRENEAALTRSLLRPGRVIALGGGAIETEEVRRDLRENALVLWIDEDEARIRRRIAEAPAARPSVTARDADPVAEIRTLLERRRPCYEEVADLRLPPGDDLEARRDRALREIERTCTW